MRFSEVFNITRTRSDDWFDPHLTVDTKLFIDPLLMLVSRQADWREAHDELIAHFVHCYELVARGGSRTSTSARLAHRLLTFPEPSEFCLGYTVGGTQGAGSGPRFATMMMDGIASAIAAGLREPKHIEEIGILNEGIGADRISDAVCNVLKQRFIRYTQKIVERHSIPKELHKIRNARCFLAQGRWVPESIELPTNPTTHQPILLVPNSLLNSLDLLNADDWFDASLNSDLRNQFNSEVGGRVHKEDIVRFARLHPGRVRQWAQEQTSRTDIQGYDFSDDPKGVVKWDTETKTYGEAHPIEATPPRNQQELSALLVKVLQAFRHFIESQRGWDLLWNDDGGEKSEEAGQLLFLGIAQHYLRLFDVEIDREVELGRGPADFKMSRGTSCRLIIEVKKAHNGKFWNGLDHQLPSYLRSDQSSEGWFVAIRYRDNRASEQRMRELPGRVARVAAACHKDIRYFPIDGRPRVSASREH